MKKIIIITVVALLSGAFLTGCCLKCRKTKNITAMQPLHGMVWNLTQLYGEDIKATDKYEMTFTADNRVSGIGECNRFFGAYEIINEVGSIKMGPIGATMMACPNMELEAKFIQMLEKVHLYQFDGPNLYFFVDNKVAAIFAPSNKSAL